MSTLNNVTPLFRCGSCGGEGRPLDLVCDDDKVVTTVIVCPTCHARHRESLDKVRPVFGTMIDIGVPKPIATEVMGFLLDRWPDPDPDFEDELDDAG